MPAKEIKELRESGKLIESHELALKEFEAASNNIWALRNLAWSYYYLLKDTTQNEKESLQIIQKIISLQIPENETMILDKFCWAAGSTIFHVLKSHQEKQQKMKFVNVVFEQMKTLTFPPSPGFSFLIKAFHSAFKEDKNSGGNFSNEAEKYKEFIGWIGFDNFMEEDYKPYQIKGRQIMSFVEQVIIAYSKVLLKGDKVENEGIVRYDINQPKIEEFLIFLDSVIETHPEFEYSLYFKSKLILLLNKYEDAKKTLIPFVKKKKNLFWVWELLAETFHDDIDIQIGCLCKALSLNTKENFLVNVHRKLALLLIQKELFEEASIEINNEIKTREKNNWKIGNELLKLVHKDWFIKESSKNNSKFYVEQSNLAEELLYNNHQEQVIVIEYVNSSKMMVNFIKDKNLNGYFSYKHLKIKPKIGDIFKVRLNKVGDEGYFNVLTIKLSYNSSSEALKTFAGTLNIVTGKDFGFVTDVFLNDVFVSPTMIKEYKLNDGNKITGSAIMSFNKLKNMWSWKVIRIDKN